MRQLQYDKNGALLKQVGGSHYKDKAIQPIEYIHANKMGFCEDRKSTRLNSSH